MDGVDVSSTGLAGPPVIEGAHVDQPLVAFGGRVPCALRGWITTSALNILGVERVVYNATAL